MNKARIASAFLVLAGCIAAAQLQETPSSFVQVVAVRDKALDVRLRSEWSYPVAVEISPELNTATHRLNGSGYFIEVLKNDKWGKFPRRKAPPGAVWGDLPPNYLEIPPRGTVSLPAEIDPTIFGINAAMKLRLVVRVWRCETNVIGITRPIEIERSLLASASFSWIVKPQEPPLISDSHIAHKRTAVWHYPDDRQAIISQEPPKPYTGNGLLPEGTVSILTRYREPGFDVPTPHGGFWRFTDVGKLSYRGRTFAIIGNPEGISPDGQAVGFVTSVIIYDEDGDGKFESVVDVVTNLNGGDARLVFHLPSWVTR